MTFWEHFFRLLPKRPVPALAALYWHVTRRRVRARNRLRAASADLPFTYLAWIRTNEWRAEDLSHVAAEAEQWSFRPLFSILLHGSKNPPEDDLSRSLRSIQRQAYPFWECMNDTDVAPLVEQIASATGDFIVPLRIGDALSEAALLRFAEALRGEKAQVLYGDEDQLDEHGERRRPWFKPRWNQEMFLAQDYLSSAVAIETTLARDVCSNGNVDELDDLLLAVTSQAANAIVHVPHVICHVGTSNVESDERRVAAVGRHVAPQGARVTTGPYNTVKVEWPLSGYLPLVSIIIPTRDKLALLRPCIDGVLRQTDYPNLEVLIVDNDSVEKVTAEYLAEVSSDPRVRVLNYPHSYNFSAINNFAAHQARGPFLCLLNNDTEVVEPSWLTEMMRYAVKPEIGAVGAKLLYEDGSIQHAGVVVGIGGAAGHAHRFLPANQPGYFLMPHVAQFVTAVTGACLIVKKSKFEDVGGLDEEDLAVAFNDIDLCLKLQTAGWRNVYVPHAVLLHHESKSRGDDLSRPNVDRFKRELAILQKRWGTIAYDDPLHNPNLDRYSETFVCHV